jgi:ABC-type sugar transport system substrate-binding protein
MRTLSLVFLTFALALAALASPAASSDAQSNGKMAMVTLTIEGMT